MHGNPFTSKNVKSPLSHVNNERGSVLMISMLILVMLTVVGIAAMNTSNLETLVSGNERTHKENFYRAEAAANAGGQRYVNLADPTVGMTYESAGSGVSESAKIKLKGNDSGWSSALDLPNEDFESVSAAALDANSRYHIVFLSSKALDAGIANGPDRYHFAMYGESNYKNGDATILSTASVVVE